MNIEELRGLKKQLEDQILERVEFWEKILLTGISSSEEAIEIVKEMAAYLRVMAERVIAQVDMVRIDAELFNEISAWESISKLAVYGIELERIEITELGGVSKKTLLTKARVTAVLE